MKFTTKFACAAGAATLATLAAAQQAEAGIIFGATAAGATGTLYTLDAATCALATNVGPLNDASGTNYPITGMAFHPTTGVLYGSSGNNPATTAARLVTIDPATALVTLIGSFDA